MPHLPSTRLSAETNTAFATSRQFLTGWRALWLTWLVAYSASTILLWIALLNNVQEYPAPGSPWHVFAHFTLDVLFLASTACLLVCYLVMSMRTIAQDTAGQGVSSQDNASINLFQIVSIIFFLAVGLPIIEAILSSVGVSASDFFDPLYGLLSGTIAALFVGRLESKYIDLPRKIIVLLYAYAVLQMSYGVIDSPLICGAEQRQLIAVLVVSLALFSKVLLFWSVRRIIVNKYLTYYMFEFRKLLNEGAEERASVILTKLSPVKEGASSSPAK
jgi:hypothetical protein